MQRDAEAALQEGLAHYEIADGRVQFQRPGGQHRRRDAEARAQTANAPAAPRHRPVAAGAARALRLPLYDVHWAPAVVLDKGGKRGDGAIRVGLADGRVLPLNACTRQIRRALNLYDVVYVRVIEARPATTDKAGSDRARQAAGRRRAIPATGAQAQLRVRPTVQGAALVLENKTGRILAMAGSFSYPLSQLNRTAQTQRQPGSAMKPLTYLTALQKGLQPNTLVPDDPITLPPIGSGTAAATSSAAMPAPVMREKDFWTPRNADYRSGGVYHDAARAGEFSQRRDRASARRRHRRAIRSRSLDASARPRSRRKSTPTACATIRSCSARSRCG